MAELQIYGNEAPEPRDVLKGQYFNTRCRWRADIGDYLLFDGGHVDAVPMLSTNSIGGCTLIVVHGATGIGALGHIYGVDEFSVEGTAAYLSSVADALTSMLSEFSGEDPVGIDSIVFAGLNSGARELERQIHETLEMHLAHCPNYIWAEPADDYYSCALYSPATHKLALFDYDLSHLAWDDRRPESVQKGSIRDLT